MGRPLGRPVQLRHHRPVVGLRHPRHRVDGLQASRGLHRRDYIIDQRTRRVRSLLVKKGRHCVIMTHVPELLVRPLWTPTPSRYPLLWFCVEVTNHVHRAAASPRLGDGITQMTPCIPVLFTDDSLANRHVDSHHGPALILHPCFVRLPQAQGRHPPRHRRPLHPHVPALSVPDDKHPAQVGGDAFDQGHRQLGCMLADRLLVTVGVLNADMRIHHHHDVDTLS